MKPNAPDIARSGQDQPSLGDDLRALVSILWSRWRLIATIMAVFLVFGFAYIWLASPGFTSSADIFIDPRERNLVDQGAVPTGMGSSSQGADISLLESQVAILGSRTVLSTLIEQEGLADDAEFSAESSGPLSIIKDIAKAVMYGPNVGSYGSMTPVDRALATLQDAVEVKRVDQTYVISVSVTTGSAAKSARLANALANIYLADGQNASDQSTRETAQSLEARLSELRQSSEASQKAVEDYRKEHGLIDAQGALVDERQLTDLSGQVVSASVATESTRVTLENLQRDGAKAATSEVVKELQVRLDQARSEEDALAAALGPRHPRLQQASETRISLETALKSELGRVIQRATNDYENARQTETSLRALLAQSTEALNQSNGASVKLRELQQIADQNRALYDSFANKAKQMREQISLPTTTARIISSAEPSSRPSEPKLPLILAISIFLGGVVGFGTAWVQHILSPKPSLAPKRFAVLSREDHSVAAQ
jgi:uncharacterized protein involved in exopolysaccharide biosynthesis